MPLNARQELFCREYLVDLNATQAAIRAGYSEKTAASIGNENLRKPEIQSYIQEIRKESAAKVDLSREMVLEGYRKIAFYDARKFYDDQGKLLNVPDLDDETAFALSGFEVMEEKGGDGQGHQVILGYTKKVKMSDRIRALDSICKVLGYNAPEKKANTDAEGNYVPPPPPLTDQQFVIYLKAINEAAKPG